MSPPPATPIETALASALRGRDDVHLAILFGSQARGNARDDSDVDVAVLGPIADLLGLASELRAACGREIDLVRLDDPGFPILQAIVRDGRPVHEHRRGTFASWRAGALATLEIDGPWYRRMRDAWLRRAAAGTGR